MRYKFLNADGKFLACNEVNCEKITVIRDTQTDLDWEVKSSEPNDEKFFKRLMTWAEFKKLRRLSQQNCLRRLFWLANPFKARTAQFD